MTVIAAALGLGVADKFEVVTRKINNNNLIFKEPAYC